VYKSQLKTAREERQKSMGDLRHQPVYDDKVKRMEAAIAELSALPGTVTQVNNLRDLIVAGHKVAYADYPPSKDITGDFQAAYAKLQGLSGNLKAGKQASAKFVKEAGGGKN